MRSSVAKDLQRRSRVIRFFHKAFPRRIFLSLLACVASLALALGMALAAAPAQAAVGTLPGNFAVSPGGAATYTIPISVPRGSGGLTPQIALVYNSQSDNGMAGPGWTVSGFSTISRCSNTIYADGQAQAVQFVTGDDYCLDGQRLRLNGGSYGASATYDTEIQSFSLITSYTSSSTGATVTGGPAYFTVQKKDGTVYEYGNTADSQVFATGTSVVRVWALDKITDVNGNYINFTYTQDTTDGDYWPFKILYTGNGTTAPLHVIKFDWTPLTSTAVQAAYEAGSLVTQTELLSEIEIKYDGTDEFIYNLTHGITDAATGYNLLTSVQECDGAGTDCYPATTITWQQGATGWQGDVNTGSAIANQTLAQGEHLMDVNGDGIADLVYPNTVGGATNWWVMFGSIGGGFSTPVNTGIGATNYATALEIQYNGDNRADILYEASDNTWHVLESTGGTTSGNVFTDIATGLSAAAAAGFTVEDLNGHGLGDIVYSDGSGLYAYQNTGGAFSHTLTTLAAPSSSTTREIGAGSYTNFSQFNDTPMDFVGSGRGGHAALVGNSTSTTCNGDSNPGCEPTLSTTWSFFGLWPTGTSSNLSFNSTGGILIGNNLPGAIPPAGWSSPMPLNMRGDGLTDLMVGQSYTSGPDYNIFTIYSSTGTALTATYDVLGVAGSDPVFADYYGIGRQSMLVDPYQPATCNATTSDPWCVVTFQYSTTQHAFVPQAVSIPAPYPSTYVAGTLQVGDVDGRGLDDLVYLSNDGGTYNWHYQLHAGLKPDLVTSITDGFGNNYSPGYVSLAMSPASSSGVYTKGMTGTWPVVNEVPSVYVVSSYSFSDGTGGTQPTVSYAYQGLQHNMTGFSQGFSVEESTDSQNGVTVTEDYDQSMFQYGGLVDTQTTALSNGALISKTTNMPQSSTVTYGSQTRFNVSIQSSESFSYDINHNGVVISTATISNKAFDSYGDVMDQLIDTHDQAAGLDYTTEIQTTYADSTSPYCVSAPVKVITTRTNPGGASMQRVSDGSSNFDDAHCRPSQVVASSGTDNAPSVDNSDGLFLTTAYTYDQWGNVDQATVSGTGVSGSRTNSTDYSLTNGEYPDQSTNPLNQVSSETWRSDIGFKTSDSDANKQVTTYTPDDFGRLATLAHPDGSSTSWQYSSCTSSTCTHPSIYVISETVQGAGGTQSYSPSSTEYDSKGRVIRTRTTLLGGVTSYVKTIYDTLGRVIEMNNPHLSSTDVALTFYNNYDVLNRVGQILRPVSEAVKPASDTDINDSVETDFTYYSPAYAPSGTSGSVVQATTTDHVTGNTETTYKESDVLGQSIGTVDANGGTTQYSYDPYGDQVSNTAVDGLITNVIYDGVGNKVKMADPDMGTWTYSYDALGELVTQVDAKGQKVTQVFDQLGRVSTRTEYDGNGNQVVADTWSYDSATDGVGLPASVSDTNGYSKVYSYDTLSRPSAFDTVVNGTDYQVSTTYDSFGRVSTLSYPTSVAPTSTAPVASASASPTSMVSGTTVTLNGTGSTDPDGNPIQYSWSVASQPAGSNVSIANPTSSTASVVVEQGGNYTFQLIVEDADAISAPATVTVSVGSPSAPTGVTATPSPSINGSYTLSWTAPGGGILVSGYYVYESVNGGSFTNLTPSGLSATTTSYPLSGKGNGSYAYYVIAYNGAGNGPASSTVTENVYLPPAAPTGLSVSGSNPNINGSYSLNWTAPAGPITSYQIWASATSSTSGYVLAWNPSGNPPAATQPVSGAKNDTYWYYVKACNNNACGPASNVASVTVLLTPGVPPSLSFNYAGNPTSTTITSGGTVPLVWTAPSGTVTYYNLKRYDEDTLATTTPYSGSARSFSQTLTKVDDFYYYVQACNSASCSAWSNSAWVEVVSSGGGGGCKTCEPNAVPRGPVSNAEKAGATPAKATSAAPAAGTTAIPPAGGGHEGLITSATVKPGMTAAAAPAISLVPTALARERAELVVSGAAEPSEALLQARESRHERETQPQILPPASAQELAAWQKIQVGHGSRGPAYAAPVYIAYGGAKVKSAASNQYRFNVQYTYDSASGALVSVSNYNTSFVYWQAATGGSSAPTDGYGHLLGYTDGNNVSTVMSYDYATGFMTGISTGASQTSTVQQLAYSWDGFGNLTQRCDANRGLTETLGYDNLNRLTSSTVDTGASSCAGGTAGTVLNVTYNAIGDITCKGTNCSTPTYSYQDPNHPRGVTSVAGLPGTYSYDADGNMVSGNGRTIGWNVDNLPTNITSSGTVVGNNTVAGSSSISYGPDKDRYYQSATDSTTGVTTNTTYIGALFEVVTSSNGTTQYRHTIMAGGQVVAVHTINQAGTTTTDYMHSDHLGSVDALTNEQGTVVQSMSFDAFGMHRDPANWSYDLTQVTGLSGISDRGFTFQEQLDEIGLIHMNGRVYDPGIGRMISADPVVGGNRYAYVDNNPLARTDPTGYCWAGCFWQPTAPLKALNQLSNLEVFALTGLTPWDHGAINHSAYELEHNQNIQLAVALVLSVETGGASMIMFEEMGANVFWATVASGAVSGAISAGTVVALNGGSPSQVFSAMESGAWNGAKSSIISYGLGDARTYAKAEFNGLSSGMQTGLEVAGGIVGGAALSYRNNTNGRNGALGWLSHVIPSVSPSDLGLPSSFDNSALTSLAVSTGASFVTSMLQNNLDVHKAEDGALSSMLKSMLGTATGLTTGYIDEHMDGNSYPPCFEHGTWYFMGTNNTKPISIGNVKIGDSNVIPVPGSGG